MQGSPLFPHECCTVQISLRQQRKRQQHAEHSTVNISLLLGHQEVPVLHVAPVPSPSHCHSCYLASGALLHRLRLQRT
jgi:hypothetical protein